MESSEFNFKLEYNKLKQKHNLPEFEKLAEDFDVEKIVEKESTFLIREVRRAINEKITAYLHLFEILINPNAPPMFVFSILKNSSLKNKEAIKEIYEELSKIQIETMKLDTIYKEDAEIKFINNAFEAWQKLKLKIYKLIEKLEANSIKENISENRSYFD